MTAAKDFGGVDETDRLVGAWFDDRFRVVERIGAGAMGVVYRAVQEPVGREVAIKVLTPDRVADRPHLVSRFLREARLASRISHPNVMAVLDVGEADDGTFYMVTELLRGRTLAQAIAEEGRFRARRVVRIGAQLCGALGAAHAVGIVHRDLKPDNVMLLDGDTGLDSIRVLDFGVAESLSALRPATPVTAVVGTPAYMAPEAANGDRIDARADLYSLGVILYQLSTGRLPFRGRSGAEMMVAHALDPPPPMTGCSPRMAALIMRLMAKSPDDRPVSALAVQTALLTMPV